MDTPLAGEKLDQERAFIKRYTEGLAEHKVEYQADYSTPLEERPRKVPVVNVSVVSFLDCFADRKVAVAEPPELMDVDAAPTQGEHQLCFTSTSYSLDRSPGHCKTARFTASSTVYRSTPPLRPV